MIQPRSGQNLGEPGRPYVRCSDRDCQYVDLNLAPCPLRAGMFDGTDARGLLEHLASVGRPLCYACLVEKLDVSHEVIRRLAARLRNETGAAIQPGRCAACKCRRVTITLPRDLTARPAEARSGPRSSSPEEPGSLEQSARVLVALQTLGGEASCAACVALGIGQPLTAVRQAIATLDSRGAVTVTEDACSGCGRVHAVARFTRRVESRETVN